MPDLKLWSQTELEKLKRNVDRLFDDLCRDFDLPSMHHRVVGDLKFFEQGGELVATMKISNMDPDDLMITVHDRRLFIAAETEEREGGRTERRMFRREVRLPCRVDPEDVKAVFDDGILEIRLPRCKNPHGRIVRIVRK
ncbi:Hsp20/alpha crystallin family protein [Salidesulfovibrio onnuriiensis]|uniref:Hsp20/alpha crystallin family protein n=1 Tax=Salidesulfovibrio onnuriiensis TaxID=2583823 RepID=UPI0011CC12F7|nr:Hsp20/alpha crystallin family protein [Salidesulfovibrio onnuriiensis]